MLLRLVDNDMMCFWIQFYISVEWVTFHGGMGDLGWYLELGKPTHSGTSEWFCGKVLLIDGRACRSVAWEFRLGFEFFMNRASSMGRRLSFLHVVKISVLSSSFFLVSLDPCFLLECNIGAPADR